MGRPTTDTNQFSFKQLLIRISPLHALLMYMRCSCGNRAKLSPKYGETMERYKGRRICRNCNTRGNWKEEPQV